MRIVSTVSGGPELSTREQSMKLVCSVLVLLFPTKLCTGSTRPHRKIYSVYVLFIRVPMQFCTGSTGPYVGRNYYLILCFYPACAALHWKLLGL